VLNWAQQFDTFCFLDNHQYQIKPQSIECLLAAGVRSKIKANAGNALEQLQQFINIKKLNSLNTGWLFGHFGYDLQK
jgi:para-aminobenzoate synthetase component 1